MRSRLPDVTANLTPAEVDRAEFADPVMGYGGRHVGARAPARLHDLEAKRVSGKATIENGSTSVTVAEAMLDKDGLGYAFGGAPVQVTPMGSLGSAATFYASWSGDDLVITVNTDPGTDVEFAYTVEGLGR